MDRWIVLDGVDSHGRTVLWQVYVLWFFIASAFSVLVAVLPLILVEIVGKADSAMYQGWLTATTAVSGLFLCSFTGHLSDRFGRAGLLRIWCLAFAAGIVLIAFGMYTSSVSFLFIARLPAVSVPFFICLAFCADVARGSALLQSHGHIGAVWGLAALVGSFGAGFIGRMWGTFGALLSAFGFSVLALFSATALPQPPQERGDHAGFFDALRVIYRDPLLFLTVVTFAMIRVGNVNVNVVYVLYAAYRFDWKIFEVSIMLGVRGALTVYMQAAGTQALARHPPRTTIVALFVSMLAHPVSMVLLGLADTGFMFALMSIVNTVTFFAISVLTTKVAALSHKDGVAGLALGAVGSLQNCIEIGGAIGFGWLLRYTVDNVKPDTVEAGLPFFVNAVWYTLACGVLWYADHAHGENRVGWRAEKADASDDETML